MSIVHATNKKSGITYVYEAWTEFDPEKGHRVPKRKCVGKLDPVTHEVVPTGKRGRPRKPRPYEGIDIEELTTTIRDLQAQVAELRQKMQMLRDIVDELSVEAPDISALLRSAILYEPDEDPDEPDPDTDAGSGAAPEEEAE